MGFVTDKFSIRLRNLREMAELTQEQLAKELKVSRGAISYYEKGERTPDIEFLDAVSSFFDVPFEYLLGYTDNIKDKYQYMYECYGLTDAACEELEFDDTIGHIFSHIITSESFFGIKHLIKTMVENYKDFNDFAINDYLSFQITNHLKKLLSQALKIEMNSKYTDSDIEQLNKEISEILKRHEKLEKEYEEKEQMQRAQLDEKLQKDYEEMKQSTHYKARQKVHEKLAEAMIHLDEELLS